jgi:hypothetical protein
MSARHAHGRAIEFEDWEDIMHAVVRTYSGPGARELFDLLEQRKGEVEGIIGAIAGFRSYSLIRTDDGGVTVTICQDKAGTDESLNVAREWIQQNASGLGASPPTVSEGSVILQLG